MYWTVRGARPLAWVSFRNRWTCWGVSLTLPDHIGKPLLEERAERHAIRRERQAVLYVVERGDELRRDVFARLAVQHLTFAGFDTDGCAPQPVTLALVDATFVIPAAALATR